MSDYETIVRNCIKAGDLWEDPEFPAVQSSVFYHQTPPFTFQWKRPHELVADPAFVTDHFDISPGKLGDRWLTTCLGCLQTSEGLLYRVVPADQGFNEKHDYVGIFRFRIWWCGEWKEVLVDDRLPTVNNKLVFLHSQRGSPFWPCLLEKAYAKLHGSYEALKYGSSLDCLSDLTGGIAESIPIKKDSTVMSTILPNLLQMTSIVTCKVQRDNDDKEVPQANDSDQLANGIVIGESYRIYCMQKVETISGERLQVLLLRNTTGLHSDHFGGPWRSSSSALWSKLDAMTRNRLEGKLEHDGDFWMTFVDWHRSFTHVEVIHLDSDTAKDEPSLAGKTPWMLRLYHGRWQRGVTAGGCRNYIETFHLNPRLNLTLSEPDEVVVALNQHTALDPKVIGFTGYPLTSNESDACMNRDYFKSKKSLLNSQYTNSRQVSMRVTLDAAPLLVLPTTFEPGDEATFTFRVFSRYPVRIRIMDVVPAIVGSVYSKMQDLFGNSLSKTVKDFKQYEPLFNQVADDRRTINAFELQDLLENCLPNDYIKSCACLEVCRQVIMAFDSTGTGRINFNDFKNLMCSLKTWHSVFKNYTKEKSGILKAERLKDALLEVGFQLNSAILSSIMLRYLRKDGTFRFGDFVAIILNLSIAFDAFDKRDPMQTGSIRINRSEWVRMVLSC